MTPATPPRDPGFSLLELMIVLSVAGILAVIAIPGLRTYVLNARRDGIVDALVSALSQARNQAMNTRQSALLCPGTAAVAVTANACPGNNNWNSGWEVVAMNGNVATVLDSHPILETSDTITLANNSASFAFNSQGQVTSFNGNTTFDYFVVCDSRGTAYARAVTVLNSGYIQALDPGSAPKPPGGGGAPPALTCAI